MVFFLLFGLVVVFLTDTPFPFKNFDDRTVLIYIFTATVSAGDTTILIDSLFAYFPCILKKLIE